MPLFPRMSSVILEGVVGSKAYGLDTPDSDTDKKGIFVVPTISLLGLRPPVDTVTTTNPDYQAFELQKFVKLASAANPTILELLYLNDYTTLKSEGELLIQERFAFLSNRVRATYGGYAKSQIERLKRRAAEGDASFSSDTRKRYSKHARHCFRLILQGRRLLETGDLQVKVDAATRERLFAVGEIKDVEKLEQMFLQELEGFDSAKSVLPEEPDYDAIDGLLWQIRSYHV